MADEQEKEVVQPTLGAMRAMRYFNNLPDPVTEEDALPGHRNIVSRDFRDVPADPTTVNWTGASKTEGWETAPQQVREQPGLSFAPGQLELTTILVRVFTQDLLAKERLITNIGPDTALIMNRPEQNSTSGLSTYPLVAGASLTLRNLGEVFARANATTATLGVITEYY